MQIARIKSSWAPLRALNVTRPASETFRAKSFNSSRSWFALDESRPLFCFAGIWRPLTGTRGTKANPVEGEHQLYSLLTCEPNAVVEPIHAKAMPVMLTTDFEIDLWLNGDTEEALRLQRPLQAGEMMIVAKGERQDGAP